MSFFNFDEKIDGSFESGGGSFEPIPAKTQVLAAPDEAKWDEYEGDKFISLRWSIIAPKEYKGRKVFHKVRVLDNDPRKAEKAKRMLAAIDANAGGKLMKSNEEPTDKSLTMSLVNKPMVLMLQVWEMTGSDGQPRSGNWVSAVSPRKGSEPVEDVAVEPEPIAEDDNFEDDVPF